MAFNGVFLSAIIVYICATLSRSIYIGVKNKLKKVCKIFGICKIITTFALGKGYIV